MYLCTETWHGQKAENSPLKAYHGLQGRAKLETKTWLSKTRQNETRKQLVEKILILVRKNNTGRFSVPEKEIIMSKEKTIPEH